jgi:hypothetical protein
LLNQKTLDHRATIKAAFDAEASRISAEFPDVPRAEIEAMLLAEVLNDWGWKNAGQ